MFFRFLFAVLLSVSVINPVQAKQEIVWVHSDYPPAHIVRGEHIGDGYADRTLALLINRMPGYQHIKIGANYARATQDLANHSNYCHTALLKTNEREKSILFSVPTYVISSFKVFVSKQKIDSIYPFLTQDKLLDLRRLLAETDFVLGVTVGSAHGNTIDDIVSEFNDGKLGRVIDLTSMNHFELLSRMTSKKNRLDGFVAASVEEKFFQPLNESEESLVSFYIKGMSNYEFGYIGCSKSELGKSIIKEINEIALEHRKNLISEYYQSWLSKEAVERHKILVNSLF